MRLDDHPTVVAYRRGQKTPVNEDTLDADWLRDLCLSCGADDVGFVSVSSPEIAAYRGEVAALMPKAKSLISLTCRMTREPVISPVRSVANHEFHETYASVNHAARKIVQTLREHGVVALNSVAAFPMEAGDFPNKNWPISHKPIAVAAGIGHVGLHRNLIHPEFGNFILLDTILLRNEISEDTQPLDFDPCLDCKLCVAACPVDAIGQDGSFNFSACYTHNYRDFLGGFVDWVDQVVESEDADDYRTRITEGETVAMWQSLSFKPDYKAAYCISVCPAGTDVIGAFLDDRISYNKEIIQPLKDKAETVYVLPGSDAENSVAKRFPNKKPKRVSWTVTAPNIYSFLFNLTLTFQKMKSKGVLLACNLVLTGDAPVNASLTIGDRKLEVGFSHVETPDLTVHADQTLWMTSFELDFDLERALSSKAIKVEGSEYDYRTLVSCFIKYGRVPSAFLPEDEPEPVG